MEAKVWCGVRITRADMFCCLIPSCLIHLHVGKRKNGNWLTQIQQNNLPYQNKSTDDTEIGR